MRRVVCFLLALGALAAFGQDQPKPATDAKPAIDAKQAAADALKNLSFMEGNWAGQQNFNNSMVGDATDNIANCVAGRYLCEQLSTTLPNRKPTDTRHFISFDQKSGKYTAWWFNDTSVHPTSLTGDLTGQKLVLESDASGPGPLLRATYELTPDNKLTYQVEMKQGDAWTKLFLTTYAKK